MLCAAGGLATLGSMGDEHADRRIDHRAAIELKVEYKRVNTFLADYTKNISRGGTFIATDRPLAEGTEFVFALSIPTLEEPLRLSGKVIWTVSTEIASKANPAGMGIEFQYKDDAERAEKEGQVEKIFFLQFGDHLATKLLGR